MSTIHIVTAVNDEYAKHLAVAVYSLLENKLSTNPIIFYIIDSNISKKNKSLLATTVKRFNKAEVKYVKIDQNLYDTFLLTHHLTKETYHRISIPDLLDKDIEKVIYLDSDIIIKEDITELWDINIDQYFLSAVPDVWLALKKTRHSSLSISTDYSYFNAGILVMNLKKWREHNITNQIIDFISKNQKVILYPSQDPMNAVLYDKWFQLDDKWNYQSKHLLFPDRRINPAIIHYSGSEKPWNSDHPLKNEYSKYAKKVEKFKK